MKILKTIKKTLYAVADVYINPGAYARLSRDGFYKDQQNLRGDVAKVGNDMKKTITRYGERAYQSQGD